MQRWFSRFSFGSEGLSCDVHDTFFPFGVHLNLGSWNTITLCPFQSSFSETFTGVMWSVLVNAVRDGMVNSPEHAAV